MSKQPYFQKIMSFARKSIVIFHYSVSYVKAVQGGRPMCVFTEERKTQVSGTWMPARGMSLKEKIGRFKCDGRQKTAFHKHKYIEN